MHNRIKTPERREAIRARKALRKALKIADRRGLSRRARRAWLKTARYRVKMAMKRI